MNPFTVVWYLLYNLFLTIAFALTSPFLPILILFGPRYREGLLQRLGFYPREISLALAGESPIWIHAASVGEVRSAEALARALKERIRGRKILLSTFTATGNRLGRQIAAVDGVIFFPVDLVWIVRRALAKFNPALVIIIETEIWPNFLRQTYRRGIPTLLLSGRLTARASARYRLCQSFFRRVLGSFTVLGMQTAEDAVRIVDLGAEKNRVCVVGSLKTVAPSHHAAVNRFASTRHAKPLLVAGSTHSGEEEILLTALMLTRARFADLSMVIAPRHPERFGDVERLLRHSPLMIQRRSQADPTDWFDQDVLLLDSVGELVDFFAVADVAFVGGSLVEVGGHNISEPAGFAKPLLFGPHMGNFHHLAEQMKREGAALEVTGAEDLAAALSDLLADPNKRQQMGQKAAQIVSSHQQAFSANLRLAERYL